MEPCNIKPMDAFCRLYSQQYPFLLDSCDLGRYSFVGANPFALIKAQNNKVEIIQGSTRRIVTDNIFSVINSVLNEFKIMGADSKSAFGKNIPFHGGAAGYLGYELKNQLEQLPRKRAAEPNTPDAILGLYDTIFAYDHKINKGYVLAYDLTEKNGAMRKLSAKEKINQFFDIIHQPQAGWALSTKKYAGKTAGKARPATIALSNPPILPLVKDGKNEFIKSNFTKNGYMNAIRRVQNYITSGDIYQANISQRLTVDFHGNPLAFYSRLRKINPAGFGAFLNYGDFQIISNSPERLLKVNNGIAETSPIKGTRPRGKNPQKDAVFINELKMSSKELSEHIMIVDLERNDLGKICGYGTIGVRPMQKICTYATLHHMVSTVKGKIRENIGPADCIKALFPGGSVTGAPKIRAMEIIEDLEPMPRGIYTGAIGYIDICGNVDLSMAIRTAVLKNKRLHLNVGGGIVADSNPEDEYEETILKANAFLKALKE